MVRHHNTPTMTMSSSASSVPVQCACAELAERTLIGTAKYHNVLYSAVVDCRRGRGRGQQREVRFMDISVWSRCYAVSCLRGVVCETGGALVNG